MTPADGSTAGAPDAIGRYRIVERLASGATGDVFKGFDPVLQRPLSIKLLRVALDAHEPAAADRIKERFYREIQRVAALVHPGIARLFDGGEAPGGFFMASEFVEGVSLADLIAEARPLDLRTRVSLLRQIAEALEYAREHDAPHLNLKPTNVLVGPDHAVKIAGFGTARVQDAAAAGARAWMTRFTAPELASGSADARADVYSFGAIGVELFGGAPVTPADARPARWMEEGSLPLLPALAGNAGVATAAAVLGRALSSDVERRYPSALACFDALSAALGVGVQKAAGLWDAPLAAAGITPEQLKQIESAATQPGLPTFVRKPSADAEATSAETAAGGRDAKETDDAAAPRLAPPPPQPSSETIAAPPMQPAAPSSDPSEGKTVLMPAAPKPPRFDRPEPRSAEPAPATDADAGKTILIPRKKTDLPPAGPDAGKTILIPRTKAGDAPLEPSEVRTTLMPSVPKAPKFEAPPVERSEVRTTLMPSVPKAPKFEAPAPKDPAGEAVIGRAPEDPGRTIMLSASDAQGATAQGASEVKTTLMPSAPKAPVFDPASKAKPSAAAPAPAAAKPPPRAIAFPPPPPAAARVTPASVKRSSGAGPLLIVVAVIALLSIVAVVTWYAVPSVRERFAPSVPSRTVSSVVPAPPIPSASATSTPGPASSATSPTSATSSVVAPEPAATATSAPATAAQTVVATGSLRVTSTPAGAAVSIDGRRRGVTPLRVGGISFGDHAIDLSLDGYTPERRSVTLSARRASQTIDARLARVVVAPTTGAISIVTEPAGARVLVDGSVAGVAPLTVANLSPGRHAVQAERDGYETATRDVDLKAGETQVVNVRLTAGQTARPAETRAPAAPISFEAVEIKPRQIRGPATPPYPRAAAQARIAGAVQLAWVIDESGSVSDVQVVESSSKLFENEAVAWARGLRYEPGRQAGKPVKVRLVRRFSFQPGR